MTRQHFKAIADALNEVRTTVVMTRNPLLAKHAALDAAAHNLADACAEFNPRFDRDKFLKACGV